MVQEVLFEFFSQFCSQSIFNFGDMQCNCLDVIVFQNLVCMLKFWLYFDLCREHFLFKVFFFWGWFVRFFFLFKIQFKFFVFWEMYFFLEEFFVLVLVINCSYVFSNDLYFCSFYLLSGNIQGISGFFLCLRIQSCV